MPKPVIQTAEGGRSCTGACRGSASPHGQTHKLIYFWTKDQWELFDLAKDPYELHNLYGQLAHEKLTEELKVELARALPCAIRLRRPTPSARSNRLQFAAYP